MVGVMIAQWGNECILSVLPMARVMINQWESECISLSALLVARVQFPAVAEYFEGVSSADHTLPAGQKMAQSPPPNGTIQSVDIEEELRPKFNRRQTMAKNSNIKSAE